jgi:ADP-ribose pyrophosphatase
MHRGPVFGVRRELVREPNGVTATRDVVTHSGSVVVLPVLGDGRMVMIRQYRHAVGRYLWELVAGRIDPGEPPLRAAHRELLEETGYRARRMVKLFKAFPTPGFVQEFMIVYAATGLTRGAARPEEDEVITARPFTLRQLERMMRQGRLQDAKSIAGILFFARFIRK